MSRMIIAERDRKLSTALSRLARMLNVEPVVAFNESKVSETLIKGDVCAVLLNIELRNIQPAAIVTLAQKIAKLFEVQEIPVVFMYQKAMIHQLTDILKLPHLDDLMKPFSIIDVYQILNQRIQLEKKPSQNEIYQQQMSEFNKYLEEMNAWLKKHNEYT